MTKKEFIEKYGKELFFFKRYYKYTFTFYHLDEITGNSVEISFGGDSSSIYRLDLDGSVSPLWIMMQFDDDEWSFKIKTEWDDLIVEG